VTILVTKIPNRQSSVQPRIKLMLIRLASLLFVGYSFPITFKITCSLCEGNVDCHQNKRITYHTTMMSQTRHLIVMTGTTAHYSSSKKLSPHDGDQRICFTDAPKTNPLHASICNDTRRQIENIDINPFNNSKYIDLPPQHSSVCTGLSAFDPPSVPAMNNNPLIGRRIVKQRIRGRRSSSLPRRQLNKQQTRAEPIYKVSGSGSSYAAVRLTFATNREDERVPPLPPEPKNSLRRALTPEPPTSSLQKKSFQNHCHQQPVKLSNQKSEA
jgi:hypothetical protein